MKAEIIAIGSELLVPGRAESNSIFLTEKLASVGIPVVFRAVVGDDEIRIAKLVSAALEHAALVLTTGGLGPTSDDRTREGVSRALGRKLLVDETILEGIRERFQRRGVAMPEVNRRQAMVPEGAIVLANPAGTAPGLWIDAGDGRAVVLLPGPPHELRGMVERDVIARLKGVHRPMYHIKKLWVAGLPESTVEQRIGDLYREVDNPVTSILASAGQVEVRLTACAPTAREAGALNENLAAKLREALGDAVFSENEVPLEAVVGRLLAERKLHIATAESITGGLIAHRITEVPGSSRYFDQGFVTYSNESKTELLGVPSRLFETAGAVSEEVARAMAEGALERTGSDVAVSVTGIAGPSGGSPEKPVGLVYVGVATGGAVRVERYQLPGGRRQIKRWTSQMALNLVRLELARSAESG